MEEHTKFLYAKIFQAFERRGEEFLCIFLLAVMVTCVFVQVIARYLFSTAITWSEELAGFCMAWAVYMGGSLGVRERFHIRIAMGVAVLPRKIAVSLIVLGDLFWMAFNVAMIFLGNRVLIASLAENLHCALIGHRTEMAANDSGLGLHPDVLTTDSSICSLAKRK